MDFCLISQVSFLHSDSKVLLLFCLSVCLSGSVCLSVFFLLPIPYTSFHFDPAFRMHELSSQPWFSSHGDGQSLQRDQDRPFTQGAKRNLCATFLYLNLPA